MSGLFGFSIGSLEGIPSIIDACAKSLVHSKSDVVDQIYTDDTLTATRVHKGILGDKVTPSKSDNIFCWTDGEAYNYDDLKSEITNPEAPLSSILISLYLKGNLQVNLPKINGYFSAVLFDKSKNELLLISDRHGLKFLYYYFDGRNISWSSEIKGFFKLPFFKPEVDIANFECFIDLGYILGKGTWFKNVSLLRPATIVKVDLNKMNIQENIYWSWGEIKKNDHSFEQAKREIGEHLVEAVQRRYDVSEPIVIPLSGGLDSRSILASLNEANVPTYTFGIKGSEDVIIAEEVAKKMKLENTFFELKKENFFLNKVNGIWKSDGLFNMKHMHFSAFHKGISDLGKILLNGFLGGEVMAANYVSTKSNNTRINEQIAFKLYGKHHELDDVNNPYYDCDHMDVYQLNNRGRRWVVPSTVEASSEVEHRKPFFDYDLIDYAYSLPDEYRVNSKLYNAMIKSKMPELFKNIPWQKKGVPLLGSLVPYYKLKRLTKRVLLKLGFKAFSVAYVDYVNWFNYDPVRILFDQLIESKDAIYSNYTNSDEVINLWKLFKSGKVKHLYKKKEIYIEELISRIVTVEIYFQQVFNNKFKIDHGYQVSLYR